MIGFDRFAAWLHRWRHRGRCDGEWRRIRLTLPTIALGNRLLEVINDAALAVNIPFVNERPAVEQQGANRLARAVAQGIGNAIQSPRLVPGVDLGIGALHPP